MWNWLMVNHYFVADVSNHWGRCYCHFFVHARLVCIFCVYKNTGKTFSSDLRKPCLKTGKSLSPPTKLILFKRKSPSTKLPLYQIETVPVPILDANNKAQSYTQLKIEKPYIALNDETYISLHSQELNTCKRTGYEYFYEELFVVKSKHRYSCASAVYFNLNNEIKENCDFSYYFNKTNVTPSVLDGGQQIILANWPNYKRIIC